jgi:hypothetical protein
VLIVCDRRFRVNGCHSGGRLRLKACRSAHTTTVEYELRPQVGETTPFHWGDQYSLPGDGLQWRHAYSHVASYEALENVYEDDSAANRRPVPLVQQNIRF